MLEFRHLRVAVSGRIVLNDASHVVPSGCIHAIVGPSGSGKTTLLRALCGLVPSDGEILVDGRTVHDLPTHRRGIGMMFQDDQLFPTMNVARNVGYGPRVAGVDRATVESRAAEMLGLVGLAGFGRRDPRTLSGGERRRVSLARCLAAGPRVVLLDEPMTGLHAELRSQLIADVARVLRSTGTTSIVVTHDLDEARAVADAVVRLSDLDEE